jgi:hypothetical protein
MTTVALVPGAVRRQRLEKLRHRRGHSDQLPSLEELQSDVAPRNLDYIYLCGSNGARCPWKFQRAIQTRPVIVLRSHIPEVPEPHVLPRRRPLLTSSVSCLFPSLHLFTFCTPPIVTHRSYPRSAFFSVSSGLAYTTQSSPHFRHIFCHSGTHPAYRFLIRLLAHFMSSIAEFGQSHACCAFFHRSIAIC